MLLNHIALGTLLSILTLPSGVDAGGSGGIARLSAIEQTPRAGRLLRSSSSADNDGDGSHHGRIQLDLVDAALLIDASSIELSLPSMIGLEGGEGETKMASYAYDLDWRDEIGGGWHGKLRNAGGSSGSETAHFFGATPSEDLGENRLAGMIHRADGMTLRITTKPDGTHWYEIWDDALAIAADAADRDREAVEEDDKDDDASSRRDLQAPDPGAFGDDKGSIIDHLSVYERRAMCEHAMVGFYPCPATPYIRAPIEEFIALQVTVVNYVLTNTHVPTQLRSVHVFMDEDYDQIEVAAVEMEADPTKSEIGVALSDLKNIDSGHLEEARRRQNQYCADIVTFFATKGLGLASGPYNVCNHGSGGWCFAHEIGHSINAGHRNDSPDKEGYKYGYGYGPDRSDESYYATIMAFGGKKIPMYSTPDYTWEGKIVGTATENNRQSIIDNLHKTANKRRSEMCNASCEYGSNGEPLGCPSTCSKCHFPSDFCYDDPFFRYQDEVGKNCEWVRSNPGKCDNVVKTEDGRDQLVQERCPVSCNACDVPNSAPTYPPNPAGECIDDPTFRKNSVENNDCDWVSKSISTRCHNNAGDGYLEGEKIYEYCRLTCGMCHLDNTPPPTPTPCADVPGYHFRSGTKDCNWIAENLLVRCDKYSKTETYCRKTCGYCSETSPTTSPTAWGGCVDNEEWMYKAVDNKYSYLNCAWVREDPTDRCLHSKMKHYCPSTCDTCCKDEEGWYYRINSESGGNPEKTCAWYAENGCNNAADDHCPRTCGTCPNYLANAGGPHPVRKARHLRGVDES